jgi:hypothetical protein
MALEAEWVFDAAFVMSRLRVTFCAYSKPKLKKWVSENTGSVYPPFEKKKAIPLQAWTGPEGSRRLRLPDFQTVGT